MIGSSRSARRLVAGLRGFASKKKPDFYKQSASSTAEPTAASKHPGPQQAAGSATEASKAAQTNPAAAGPAPGAAAAAKPAAPPSAAAAPAPAPPPAATAASPAAATKPAPAAASQPAGSGAAAAPKPSAAPAPSTGAPSAAAAAAAPNTAASAVPKPAPPAGNPGATSAGTPKPAAPAPAAAPSPAAAAAAAAPKAAAGGGVSAGAPGGGGGGGNSWLLHPVLPVDVRLLGAGLAGAGALAYSFAASGGDGGADQPPTKSAGVVVDEETGFSMQPEAPPQAAEEAAQSARQAGEAEAATAAAAIAGGAAGAAGGPEAGAAGEPQAGAKEGGAEEEEPVYVEASQVLGVIEEVFSKEASQQLAELEARAEAETAAAAAASQDNVTAAGREAAAGQAPAHEPSTHAPAAAPEHPAAAPAAEAAGGPAAAPGNNSKGGGKAAVRRAEEEVAAMRAAVADQVGESVASSFGQSQPGAVTMSDLLQAGQKAMGAEETLAEPAAAAPVAADAEAVARARELLGLRQDLSAAGLIAEAVKLGMGPAADWSDYDQRHRQAEADAVVLSRLLETAGAHVAAQLAAAAREGEAGRAEAAAARRQLAQQADNFRLVLKEALGRAEEQQRQQLRRQAEQLATAHAEMTVRERAERAAKLDGVREKLNTLERAFQRRSNEQRTSHQAHQLSLGVFALLSALAGGQPLADALTFLQGLAGSDPVVAAALQAVPVAAAAAPVPTRGQLSDQFQDVSRLTRQLSMLPEGHGGMLSVAVAKLAAQLKIAERGPLAAAMPGDGIDRRLAAAQQAVVDGQLLAAAAELEAAVAGTAAAPVVARWAQAVRVRAAAEQSAALLEAHAAAQTASLA